ncbi:MAG: hypothetical protein RLZZ136_1620, partial [Pseudomonadota bacterium]
MINRRLAVALLLASVATLGGLSACNTSEDSKVVHISGTALGIDTGALDKTIKPGDDFYAYANGGWMKRTEIPADRSAIGGFAVADIRTETQLSDLVEDIAKGDPAPDSNAGRIKALYRSYLNTKVIESAGMTPIAPDLNRIAAIVSVKDLSREMGSQLRADVDPLNATNFHTENLFGLFVTQSLPGTAVMPYFLQGGLGLPEREYYLSADPKIAALRGQYRSYIAKLLTDAGIPDADLRAGRIFD